MPSLGVCVHNDKISMRDISGLPLRSPNLHQTPLPAGSGPSQQIKHRATTEMPCAAQAKQTFARALFIHRLQISIKCTICKGRGAVWVDFRIEPPFSGGWIGAQPRINRKNIELSSSTQCWAHAALERRIHRNWIGFRADPQRAAQPPRNCLPSASASMCVCVFVYDCKCVVASTDIHVPFKYCALQAEWIDLTRDRVALGHVVPNGI